MTVFAYACIGGPLDGGYATAEDFLGGDRFLGYTGKGSGRYVGLAGEYTPYDWPVMRAVSSLAGDFPPRRVYLHRSVLKPTKLAGDR